MFSALPRPDTRKVSTSPPKVHFPIHIIGTVDVWQDWPPAWWPPRPPAGWPPVPLDLDLPSRGWPASGTQWPPRMPWGDVPDEYWDFARRFMVQAWKIAFHRLDLGLYAGFPWFDLNNGMMCQPWTLDAACRYLVTNWDTHYHTVNGSVGGTATTALPSPSFTDSGTFQVGI